MSTTPIEIPLTAGTKGAAAACDFPCELVIRGAAHRPAFVLQVHIEPGGIPTGEPIHAAGEYRIEGAYTGHPHQLSISLLNGDASGLTAVLR
jgi:hypothetical protein